MYFYQALAPRYGWDNLVKSYWVHPQVLSPLLPLTSTLYIISVQITLKLCKDREENKVAADGEAVSCDWVRLAAEECTLDLSRIFGTD